MKILFIDDCRMERYLMQIAAKETGHQIVVFEESDDLYRHIQKTPNLNDTYHVAILDYMIEPTVTGLDVAKKLRQKRYFNPIYIHTNSVDALLELETPEINEICQKGKSLSERLALLNSLKAGTGTEQFSR